MDDDEIEQDLRLISKLSKDKRWNITPRVRRKVMETLEAAMDSVDIEVALKATEVILKADALNLASERMDGGSGEQAGQVREVLLLPMNSTEKP